MLIPWTKTRFQPTLYMFPSQTLGWVLGPGIVFLQKITAWVWPNNCFRGRRLQPKISPLTTTKICFNQSEQVAVSSLVKIPTCMSLKHKASHHLRSLKCTFPSGISCLTSPDYKKTLLFQIQGLESWLKICEAIWINLITVYVITSTGSSLYLF